jgi:RHS repeat-associated protein
VNIRVLRQLVWIFGISYLRIILPNGSVRTRVYDDAGQTREIRDFWAESGRLIALQRFDYNEAGEVKSRLGVPFDYGKAPSSFDAIYDAENRLFSANGVVTSHDDDGNLLFAADPLYGGTMALSYNSRNQLLSAAVGGVSGSFTYDAEGHRQSATHAGQTSTFTVNPAAELSQVLVRQVEGGQRTWAVYGLGLLYEVEIESVGEPVYTLVGGDIMTLVSQVTERLRVHHYDQTGNTVAITDGQGRDVLWVQYDAYGAVVHAESPTQADGGAPVRLEVNALPDGLQRALAVTPWLYVGEHGVMTDPTGLLHMRARYYHPGLRRFLNADPIQFEGGMNWYGYVEGNPIIGIDPSGHYLIWVRHKNSGVKIVESNGNTQFVSQPDDLIAALNAISNRNSKVSLMHFVSHATNESMTIGNTATRLEVNTDRQGNKRIELIDNQVRSTKNVTSLFQAVTDSNSSVFLDGCKTAQQRYNWGIVSNNYNIAEDLSFALPGVATKGNHGFAFGSTGVYFGLWGEEHSYRQPPRKNKRN